ncbi:MAG: Rossmann-like and DUF2520 domain-containing protein [Gemmatimonadaceae bacterium]
MSERVFVLGAGRAGTGLTRAFRMSGVPVVGLHGRHVHEGRDPVTAGAIPGTVAMATVVLVTVRDAQIDDALRELLEAPLAPDAVVLHASGSAEPAMLEQVRARGHAAGTFHPLVPIADPVRAPQQLCGAWVGIDGDERAKAASRDLAAALGCRVFDIPQGQKARYHAAAVIVSNFPAVLLAVGDRVLAETGIPADTAEQALRALFFAAIGNLRRQHGAASLTGPIIRGDADTVRRHLGALADDSGALELYRSLSHALVDLASEAGTDADRLRAIRALLD